MGTKKNRFLMLTLIVLIAVGVFIKTEETLGCACRTYGPDLFGLCGFDLFIDTCSETGHACLSEPSITNRTNCVIDGTNNVNFAGCVSGDSWRYCSETLCNTYVAGLLVEDATTNGATCKVSTLGKLTCDHTVQGKWDNSDKKCVVCDVNNIEIEVAGDNLSTYVDSAGAGGPYFVNAIGVGKKDGKFESACGADAVCDEKSAGDACGGGKTCDASGICVMAAGLTLTATADPTAIAIGGSSTITFKVTKGGVDMPGALVDSISITAGGGSITGNLVGCTSDYCCTTNAVGECTVTYDNAPAAATVATVTSAEATKAAETDSSPASAVVTAAAADWICDPLGDPDYSDACGVLSVLDTCESLDGPGPGCVGAWEDCGDMGCNAGCNGVCGTCVTAYQACDCVCGDGGCTPGALVCGVWSACGSVTPGSQSQNCNDGCSNSTMTQSCCTDVDADADGNHDDCVGAPGGAICDTSVPGGRCVSCMTNDDCPGTDVCDIANNACIPCVEEGVVPPVNDVLLCCAGLDLWDVNSDGQDECTSACNPNIGFLCNTLRGSVDTIAQGGEQMIGYILGIIGSVALLLIIIAGIMYMTAAGVEEKITSAKRILTGAVIGLGIALLAFSLLQVIMTVLNM